MSCLKLVHAMLIRAAVRWQRISITPLEYEQLKLLYQELKITAAADKEMEVKGRLGGTSRPRELLHISGLDRTWTSPTLGAHPR